MAEKESFEDKAKRVFSQHGLEVVRDDSGRLSISEEVPYSVWATILSSWFDYDLVSSRAIRMQVGKSGVPHNQGV